MLLILLLLSLPELAEFLHLLLTEGLACGVVGGDACAHVGWGEGAGEGVGACVSVEKDPQGDDCADLAHRRHCIYQFETGTSLEEEQQPEPLSAASGGREGRVGKEGGEEREGRRGSGKRERGEGGGNGKRERGGRGGEGRGGEGRRGEEGGRGGEGRRGEEREGGEVAQGTASSLVLQL